MDDFVLILYTVLLAVVSVVILVFLTRYQMDLMLILLDEKIANKLKTFPATLAKSRGSSREPSNWETIATLAQTFMAMRAEGISVKDILSEFGLSVAEETVKAAVAPTKDI